MSSQVNDSMPDSNVTATSAPGDELIFSGLERNAAAVPDQIAVNYLGEKYSFAELWRLTGRFASGLHALGIDKGDRVLLYTQNCVQWVIAYFGLQRIGAVPVPVSPIYTAFEVEYMANHSEAVAVICQDTNISYIEELLPNTDIQDVIVINLADILPRWKRALGFLFDKVPTGRVDLGGSVHAFMDVLRKNKMDPPQVEIDPGEDLAYILYTGGTTGFPKGVPGTHRGMVSFLQDVLNMYGEVLRSQEDIFVLVTPLFHILPFGMFVSLGLDNACTTVIMPQPQGDAVLEAIQRHQATLFLGVPALYRMLLENDRLEQYNLRSLRISWSGGDTLPVEVFNRWLEKSGVKILQVYGSTEVGFVSMSPPNREVPPGTIGALLASRRHRIVESDSLKPVEPGEVGELLITNDHTPKAYWDNPEETAQAYVELNGETWYRTGDFVRQAGDEIRFVERSTDIIKYKGYRVSASEIEVCLQDHPAVIGACVVGVPDTSVGERIKGLVVLQEGSRGVGAGELMQWCRTRLAPYKVPHYLEFRDMLPKSKVGKLLRREVRDEESRRLAKEAKSQAG